MEHDHKASDLMDPFFHLYVSVGGRVCFFFFFGKAASPLVVGFKEHHAFGNRDACNYIIQLYIFSYNTHTICICNNYILLIYILTYSSDEIRNVR